MTSKQFGRTPDLDADGGCPERCHIAAVVFDIGETVLDDTAEWGRWADWIGVPRHTFSAVMGAVGAQGRNIVETFDYFVPGFDLAEQRQRREDTGHGEQITDGDLYPDVRPALQLLRDGGLWVGLAGNQTARAGELLRALDLPVHAVATSGEWGLRKPDPAFFDRLVAWASSRPRDIVYVGDHPANDLEPARAAGLRTAHLRRGPWGHLSGSGVSVMATADWSTSSLIDLAGLLLGHTR